MLVIFAGIVYNAKGGKERRTVNYDTGYCTTSL